jgi:hypothetical protein
MRKVLTEYLSQLPVPSAVSGSRLRRATPWGVMLSHWSPEIVNCCVFERVCYRKEAWSLGLDEVLLPGKLPLPSPREGQAPTQAQVERLNPPKQRPGVSCQEQALMGQFPAGFCCSHPGNREGLVLS